VILAQLRGLRSQGGQWALAGMRTTSHALVSTQKGEGGSNSHESMLREGNRGGGVNGRGFRSGGKMGRVRGVKSGRSANAWSHGEGVPTTGRGGGGRREQRTRGGGGSGREESGAWAGCLGPTR
jgi:hypothetical protein